MKYRITVMGDGVDLRGSMEAKDVNAFALALQPLGMLILASPLPEENDE